MQTTSIIVGIFIGIAALLYLLLWMGNNGIPWLEGDSYFDEGSAYGFNIGDSKTSTFEALESQFVLPESKLSVVWLRDSEIGSILSDFDDGRSTSKYGTYTVLLSDMDELKKPLIATELWRIEMPGSWVNSIYLYFEKDKLVKIGRSKWLFERP